MSEQLVLIIERYGDKYAYGPFDSWEAAYTEQMKQRGGDIIPLYSPE